MLLHALSVGREVDVWGPRTGVVHSVFDRAVNLLVDGEMWTVLGDERHDAPFGIRLVAGERPPTQVGDTVHGKAGFIRLGRAVVDCRAAARWAPAEIPQPAPGLASRVGVVEQFAQRRAWSESACIAGEVYAALHQSDPELAAVVRRTVGRGPGLTPAGDDVLAGIFAALSSRDAARLARATAQVLGSTPDISRHLLHQAARGLPGRALHELATAVIGGASHETLTHSLALVLDTGATSGADACMGLAAACRFSFLNLETLAA